MGVACSGALRQERNEVEVDILDKRTDTIVSERFDLGGKLFSYFRKNGEAARMRGMDIAAVSA